MRDGDDVDIVRTALKDNGVRKTLYATLTRPPGGGWTTAIGICTDALDRRFKSQQPPFSNARLLDLVVQRGFAQFTACLGVKSRRLHALFRRNSARIFAKTSSAGKVSAPSSIS